MLLRFLVALFVCALMPLGSCAQFYEQTIGLPPSNGQFDYPSSVATDASGNIYVVDTNNHRIQKFSSSGVFLNAWGSLGVGDVEFRFPRAITIDKNGNIFVADTENHRIQKLNSAGEFMVAWGSYGTGNSQFSIPYALATDPEDNVYVVDTGNHRIIKFNNSGQYISKLGNYGSGNEQFYSPQGIAIDDEGQIYIADTGNHRIQKFRSNHSHEIKWGTNGFGDGQFRNPCGVAVDANGSVFVLDRDNYRIQKFNDVGDFNSKWGNYGEDPGEFLFASGITRDVNGNILVADTENNRIQIFSDEGVFSKQLYVAIKDGQFSYPHGIAVHESGALYIVDSENNRIQKYNSAGEYQSKWGSSGSGNGQFNRPTAAACDATGNIYVVDTYNHRIQKFNSSGVYQQQWGTFGSGQGQFKSPRGIVLDKDGNIYVVDTDNHRIQKFSSAGVYQKQWGNQGSANTQFAFPIGIASDAQGNVYVADTNNSRVQVFDNAGVYLSSIGSNGTAVGQFWANYGVAVDNHGNIYVSDANNNRIQKFNKEKQFQLSWGTFGAVPSQLNRPTGIVLDGKGNIFVVNTNNKRIEKFSTLTIQSYSLKGATGASISINGSGFSTTPTHQQVTINGLEAAVTASTPTKLTVTVPANATTGKIKVKRDDIEAESSGEFLVLPLTIDSFHPQVTSGGQKVTITGKGYSSIKESIAVKINELTAEVVSTSSTAIQILLPENATSGKIKVSMLGETVTSGTNLLITDIKITGQTIPPLFTPGDQNLPITFTVNNISKVQSLRYNVQSICNPKKVLSQDIPFQNTSNTISLSIPGTSITDSLGVKVWISLTDKDALESDGPSEPVYLKTNSTHEIPNLRFGKKIEDYQIVAIPLELTRTKSSDVFKNLGETDARKWRLFEWSEEEYKENPTNIYPGIGYWLIVKKETSINPGDGSTVKVTKEEPFKMTLKKGWNLIGNPYNFTISWDDVKEHNGIMGIGNLIQYDRGLKNNSTLHRYSGGLVMSEEEVEIEIPIVNRNKTGGRKGDTKSERVNLLASNWYVPFHLSDGEFTDELHGIGMHPEAKILKDAWDEFVPPFLEGLASFDWNMRSLTEGSLARDMVSTTQNYSWETNLVNSHPVTLSWDNTRFEKTDKKLVIEMGGHTEIIDMIEVSQLKLNPGEHTIELHFGDEQYINKQIHSEELMLGNVFPNPVKRGISTLALNVNLPQRCYGQLYLVDVLGRKLLHSEGKLLEAGRSTWNWQADLRDFSTGIYYLKVSLERKEYTYKVMVH